MVIAASIVTMAYDRASCAYLITAGSSANSTPAASPVAAGYGDPAIVARRRAISAVKAAATAIATTDGARSTVGAELPATVSTACTTR